MKVLFFCVWGTVFFMIAKMAAPYVVERVGISWHSGSQTSDAAAQLAKPILTVGRPPLVLPEPVTALAWSDKGRVMAVAYHSGSFLRVFDAAGHAREEIYADLPNPDNTLVLLDAGRVLASGAIDKGADATDAMVSLWDTDAGSLINRLPGPQPAGNHVRAVAKSADEAFFATVSGTAAADSVTVFDSQTRTPVYRGSAHDLVSLDAVGGIDLSGDGGLLALGAGPRIVIRNLRDGGSGPPALSMEAFKGSGRRPVQSVSFSRDGKRVAAGAGPPLPDVTAALPYSIGIWDVERGKLRRSLPLDLSPVRALAFSPSGRYLAIVPGDQTVRVWQPDAPNAPVPSTLQFGSPVAGIAWLGDDASLAIAVGSAIEFITVSDPDTPP
jgi:WD40 repeat protein